MAVDFHTHIQEMHIDVVNSVLEKRQVFPVISGYSKKGNALALEFAEKFSLPCFIGIAPQEAQTIKLENIDNEVIIIENAIKKNKNIVGIGEIGMDFHWAKNKEHEKMQIEFFSAFLDLAEKLNVPVTLHTRKAESFVIDFLIKRNFKQKTVFHFFSGTCKDAEKAVENLDAFISIPPFHSKERKESIKKIGIEKILVETDAPYAGKTPMDVKLSITYVAKTLEISNELAEKQTSLNAFSILNNREIDNFCIKW